ncbi:hypothetical protein ACP275_08G049300 [Erythranthe tilingii]
MIRNPKTIFHMKDENMIEFFHLRKDNTYLLLFGSEETRGERMTILIDFTFRPKENCRPVYQNLAFSFFLATIQLRRFKINENLRCEGYSQYMSISTFFFKK